jgi:hypothetical protein
MLGQGTLEDYRRMLPSERLSLTLRATREALSYLLHGPAEIVDRKFELIRRENESRNRSMRQRPAAASCLEARTGFHDERQEALGANRD